MNPQELEHLRRERFLDPQGRLGGDSALLKEALAELQRRGHSAYVGVVPAGEDSRGWRRLWTELGLSDDSDLLLLWDGARWEARGWGLDDAEISRILDQNEVALQQGPAHGLVSALSGLEAAASPPGSALRTVAIGAGGLGAVAVLGGLGWILARRTRLAREERASVESARLELQDDVANLVLSAEELGEPGRALMEKAVRLRDEVKRIPASEQTRLRVARIQQLQDEVAALQSQVLAHKSRAAAPPPLSPGMDQGRDTASQRSRAPRGQEEG